jgi:hypothetical protein
MTLKEVCYKFEGALFLPTYQECVECYSENDLEVIACLNQIISTNYTKQTTTYKRGEHKTTAKSPLILVFTILGNGFRVRITKGICGDNTIFAQYMLNRQKRQKTTFI